MAETLNCSRCGAGLTREDRFCAECGDPAQPGLLLEPDDWVSPWADMVERLRRATLGEFEINGELGRGGMAAVFLAHEIALDRKVAIKVMVPGLLLGDGVIDRFRREAITMAHLHHPNIVSVHSVRHAEGLHYFIMRYVQGRSLEQVLQEAGRLPLPTVRSIVYQVGSALTYAHRSRVIHRDIKPANIMIDGEGNAIVTDFGIAKAAEAPTKTLTGALVGTPAYMSPEQCSGAEVSWAADQYALGAVAYEMLAGAPPFSGSTLTVMQSHVERSPVPLRDLREDCPPDVEAAILRMLEKDPAARWLRMPDAMAALGAVPLAEDDPFRAELGRLAVPPGDAATLSTGTTPAANRSDSADGSGPAVGRAVGAISILPPAAGLEVGDSFVLVATVRGQHNTRLPPTSVTWSSDAPDVLQFDPAGGVAFATAPGVTVLTAHCHGACAALRIEVAQPRADEIVLCPPDQALYVGDEVRLEAIVQDKRGQPVSHPVTWESGDPAIATLGADGTLIALAPGLAKVAALSGDARASLVTPILPARVAAIRISGHPSAAVRDRTFVLAAAPVDRWGRPLDGRNVVWSSSDAHVAVVTAGGRVNPLRPGSVVLTASCEGVTESVRIEVAGTPATAPAQPVIASHRRLRRHRRSPVLVTVAAAILAGGALGFLAYDNNEGVDSAAIAPTGDVVAAPVAMTGRAVPPAVEARPDRPAARPAARTRAPRRAPAIASITIAGRDRLLAGDTTTLSAVVLGRDGDTLGGRPVAWRSSNTTVALVDPRTGRVSAQSPGTVLILAESGGESSFSELTVLEAPLAAIAVRGARPLTVGESLVLSADLKDEAGAALTGRTLVWSSSDSDVAGVDAGSGVVTARSAGTVEVTARAEGKSGRVRLVVSPRREPPPATAGGGDRRRIETLVLAGVERCYDALQAKDVAQVTALYRAEAESDQRNLEKLSRILRTAEWSAEVSERVLGQRRIRGDAAAMEFTLRLSWRDPFGGRHSSRPVFRAEFARLGTEWRMSSCRIVGNPKL